METEYSNGVCGYGDFGRYTFEAYLRSWEDCEGYSASLLRNYALDIILKSINSMLMFINSMITLLTSCTEVTVL